jgi:hypothetical protein
LQVFTDASELYVPAFLNQVITPTNAQIRKQTPYGSVFVTPAPLDGATVFVQTGGNVAREYLYTDSEDAYTSTAISTVASHLLTNPIDMDVVHGAFEEALEIAKEDRGFYLDTELSADDLKALVAEYKRLVAAEWGKPFPQDVHDQLWGAVGAVFESWESERAKVYRRLNAIPAEWGTAVNVQAMVFGNMGEDCATGVCFTRDPSTGENIFYGEYLINAQGEDVVAGIRTPNPINEQGKTEQSQHQVSLETAMPKAYHALLSIRKKLEKH